MSNTFKMTKSIWQRSWTIRTLKHEYGSIVITLLGVAVAFLCLFTFSRAERWILNEKIVITPGITWVRTAKAEMTDVEYIRALFGKRSSEALFIYHAESGGQSYAINQNTDKGRTFDLGCMQLNEKWQLKPRGLTRADAFNCKKSIEVSKQIFQEQGNFCAWTSYKNANPKICK